MLENKTAAQLVTNSGIKVINIVKLDYAKSSDNAYAVELDGKVGSYLYNVDGKCTDAFDGIVDSSFDLKAVS